MTAKVWEPDHRDGTFWTFIAADRWRTARAAAPRNLQRAARRSVFAADSLIASATTTVLVGTIAALRTENFGLAALTVCAALVTLARIFIVAGYRRRATLTIRHSKLRFGVKNGRPVSRYTDKAARIHPPDVASRSRWPKLI